MPFQQASRAARMNPSIIREILKVTERPGIISLAGGLPSPETFPYEPEFVPVACDDDGPLPDALEAARGARFLYALPNFQNPSGRCMSAARRQAVVDAAMTLGLPIVEDNPYGDLWFDAPPPPSLA